MSISNILVPNNLSVFAKDITLGTEDVIRLNVKVPSESYDMILPSAAPTQNGQFLVVSDYTTGAIDFSVGQAETVVYDNWQPYGLRWDGGDNLRPVNDTPYALTGPTTNTNIPYIELPVGDYQMYINVQHQKLSAGSHSHNIKYIFSGVGGIVFFNNYNPLTNYLLTSISNIDNQAMCYSTFTFYFSVENIPLTEGLVTYTANTDDGRQVFTDYKIPWFEIKIRKVDFPTIATLTV